MVIDCYVRLLTSDDLRIIAVPGECVVENADHLYALSSLRSSAILRHSWIVPEASCTRTGATSRRCLCEIIDARLTMFAEIARLTRELNAVLIKLVVAITSLGALGKLWICTDREDHLFARQSSAPCGGSDRRCREKKKCAQHHIHATQTNQVRHDSIPCLEVGLFRRATSPSNLARLLHQLATVSCPYGTPQLARNGP